MTPTPIVKWLGGKRWLTPIVPAIRERLRGGRYIEPFLGGAAIALALHEPGMILADTCRPLITTYRQVRDRPALVALLLEELATDGVDEVSYYRTRDEFNELLVSDSWEGVEAVIAAQLLYLNTLGYNGVFRLNQQGEFNVPYGGDMCRAMRSREEIFAFSDALSSSTIIVDDFRRTLRSADEGDVVYCDPPYADTFAGYTADGFGPMDHEQLADELRQAYRRGASVLATNADSPEVRELYQWARVVPVTEARSVSQDGSKRGRAPCLVISSPDWEV